MPARSILPDFCAWPKTLCDFAFSTACLAAIPECLSCMAKDYPFRPCSNQHTLCHIQESAGPRQRLAVVPGHPVRGRLLQLPSMALQLGEIVERIDVVEFAGVNQAHEQVSHLRPISVLVKQRVLAMQDRFLQCPLHQIIVQRCSRLPQKQREFLPVIEHIRDRLTQTGVRLYFPFRELVSVAAKKGTKMAAKVVPRSEERRVGKESASR